MPLALVSLFFFFFGFNSSSSSSSSSVCNYRHYLIWTFLNFAIGISFGDLGLENNSTGRSSSSATTLILSSTVTTAWTTSTTTTTASTPSPSSQSGHLIVRREPGGLYLGPYFDSDKNQKNVTAYVGTSAYIPCHVKQLGNKSVSWIRTNDSHIVTVDRYTFIADGRFQVIPVGESWTLQIKYVQPRDAGYYECQISTAPKLAFRTQLRVLVPTIRMNGGAEQNIFVWEGSEVELRCTVEYGRPEQLTKIQWVKNGEILQENTVHHYVVFQSKIEGSSLVATANFPNARRHDSGNYTCTLEDVGAANVSLHVLNGENPAAMQRGYGTLLPSIASTIYLNKYYFLNWHTALLTLPIHKLLFYR